MRIERSLACAINELDFGYWSKKRGQYVSLDAAEEPEMKEATTELKCSVELLEAMVIFVSVLRETLRDDLTSLWDEIHEEDEE